MMMSSPTRSGGTWIHHGSPFLGKLVASILLHVPLTGPSYQNIIRIIVWFVVLTVYSQTGQYPPRIVRKL